MNTSQSEPRSPKLSVLCPCYNHEPYLRQALDGILMQKTSFPFEVLVGEDCSPDRSRDILREYETSHPGFFRMFYREKNIGGTRNFYDLLMQAQGQYAIFLETDDYWTDPCKLQKQVEFLDAHPEYIGCAHNSRIVDKAGHTIRENRFADSSAGRYTLQDFLRKGFAFQTAALMFRNFSHDGGDYSIIYQSHPLVGDLTLYSILLSRGDIFVMGENMSAYREVLEIGGTNSRSQGITHLAQSLQATMRQLVMLEGYFQGKLDYSKRKLFPAERYLSGWLRREPGFTADGMRYMWDNAGVSVQKEVIRFALGYPARKTKKIWTRLKGRDTTNG